MSINNKQQQQSKRSERGCMILSIMWVGVVGLLFQNCIHELSTLKATRDLLIQYELQPRKGMTTGTTESSSSDSIIGDYSGRHVDVEQDGRQSAQNATSSLLDMLREATNDGISQISKAVGTGLTDNAWIPTKKGHLILHVGPSKTATTSLQTDLTMAEDRGWLGEDNIHFGGRYYRPFTSNITGSLVMNRSESKLLEVARAMFREGDYDEATDFSAFRRELEAVYNERVRVAGVKDGQPTPLQTVILSDEALGNMWLDPEIYETIRDTVGAEWQVTVVIGYRRFFEWILSSKFQRDRTDRTSAGGKERWPSEGGRALLPIFPDTLENDHWRQWYHYSDTILGAVRTTFPLRMINLHTTDDASVLTQFLCDILDNADFACARSRERDVLEQTKLNTQENSAVPSLYYDALATAAAEMGWIDEKSHRRQQLRNAIRLYQEETQGLTSDDLPELCPSSSELESLYERSVEFERLYMPSLRTELVHREAFEAKIADHSYCWVDAASVLTDPHWQQFFRQFSSTK